MSASWGGKRVGAGGPRWPLESMNRKLSQRLWRSNHATVNIRNNVHATWKSLKMSGTFTNDTAFAAFLLSLEMKRRESLPTMFSNATKGKVKRKPSRRKRQKSVRGPIFASTPQKCAPAIQTNSGLLDESISSDLESYRNSDVDITGTSSTCKLDDSTIVHHLNHSVINGSVIVHHSDYSVSESDSESSCSSLQSQLSDESKVNGEISETENANISFRLKEALYVLNSDEEGSDSASDSSSSQTTEYCTSSDSQDEVEGCTDDHDDTLVLADDEDDLEEADHSEGIRESHATANNEPPVAATEELPEPLYTEPAGPAPQFTRLEEKYTHKTELGFIQGTKIICSLDMLMSALMRTTCSHEGCSLPITITKHRIQGCTLIVYFQCTKGHKSKWSSSEEYSGVYSNNFQFAVANLLSGNNFTKLHLFAQCYGLSIISEPTYFRVQRLYTIPGVIEWWQWMAEQILAELPKEGVVLSGDGQCDSPGHSAKYLCYYLMENIRNYIVHVEVVDKRETQGNSSVMEREALRRALRHLTKIIKILEVITDASSTIKKMLAEEFTGLFHSLDVWHKAKSIRKSITKVSKSKSMTKIKLWTSDIIKHFWHCSETCLTGVTSVEQAEAKFKDKWLGLLHHVCGVHYWAGGQCEHGPLDDESRQLPWFDRRDKDFEVLQKIVCDPNLLSSFKHYVKFRHTGRLESVNSMSLMYAPKRCSFQNEAFKARKVLAAVDHNYHLERVYATDRKGDPRVTRKFNPRTKVWDLKTVKVAKDYGYLPMLQANIYKRRAQSEGGMLAKTPLPQHHPKGIAHTIASVPPPPTKEIRRLSRFQKKM